jgi:dihydrolipoamide dehydrogenase
MEGIRAVEGIAGIEYEPLDYLQVPACTFTTPEIASVGMTEEKVRMAGIDYRAGKFSFVASGKAVAAGETDGFVKMICEKETGKILGVHIIGSGASEMIGGMALAMRMGAKCSDIAATIFPHPTMSEGIREVAESLCYPDIKNK